MTVQDFIDILTDTPNKDAHVVMPIEIGFISACVATSGTAKDVSG